MVVDAMLHFATSAADLHARRAAVLRGLRAGARRSVARRCAPACNRTWPRRAAPIPLARISELAALPVAALPDGW